MAEFKIENYIENSFVIVEGKKNSNNFYIVRSGKVKVFKENPVASENPYDVFGPGDFFGVVSCMSGHARIEDVSQISLMLFGLLLMHTPSPSSKHTSLPGDLPAIIHFAPG